MSSDTRQLKALIVIAGVLLVLLGGFLVFERPVTPKMPTDQMAGMNINMSGSATHTSAVATNKITISNYMFSPMAVSVKVGTTVTWTNQDDVHHTISVDGGSGPSSTLIGQGQSYSYTFHKAGTFTYHCMPHPYMHGTVVVTG